MRHYTYIGTIDTTRYRPYNSGESGGTADIIISDTWDDEKPPIRLEAHGMLGYYLVRRDWTDDEERYLNQRWTYDRSLCLVKLEVLNRDGKVAKVITRDSEYGTGLTIFGPQEPINDLNPEPLSLEEMHRMIDFRLENPWFGNVSE